MSVHAKFENFKKVGSIDVDAGSIWIGDGCYVLKDPDEARPKDLGDDWHGICSRFFERSGYHAADREWRDWDRSAETAWWKSQEYKDFMAARSTAMETIPEDQQPETHDAWIQKLVEAETTFANKWKEQHPFVPTVVDTGVAAFNHNGGHSGLGMMISTYYGDGGYPVYIEYGENGRPRRVLIDFDPGADEDDE